MHVIVLAIVVLHLGLHLRGWGSIDSLPSAAKQHLLRSIHRGRVLIVGLLGVSRRVTHLLLLQKLLVLHLANLLGFLRVHNSKLLLGHGLPAVLLLGIHGIGLSLQVDHLWATRIPVDLLEAGILQGRARV